MAKKVIMPKFGMDQEEGTVVAWLKQEGDQVEKGEPILEVETDKVNMEVEANAGGILAGIKAGPGDVVPIGRTIAYILKPGESLPEASAPQPAAATTQPAETSTSAPTPKMTPVAERMAKTHGVSPPVTGRGRITKADVAGYLTPEEDNGAKPAGSSPDKVRAVPAARRLARELGVDLDAVAGSGPKGRIQSADVQRAVERQTAQMTESQPPAGATPAVRRRVPLTGMRRTIAARLTTSAQESPQFTVSMDVELSRAMAVLDDLRLASEAGDGPRVTLTAFLVKACAWTLARHPAANAAFEDDSILEWADINVGVAVAIESGLIVPVIHGAAALTALEIAGRVNELSDRAREGQLRPEDVQGGTFTISNLGMFGVDRFTAILNPPQAAILAVSRAAKRPVVTDDDQIEIKLLADFTLTADHRVLDGALAGRFLADLKQAVERPGMLL